MYRLRSACLTAALCSGLAMAAAAQPATAAGPAPGAAPAPAESPLLFDPQQLPAFHGKVAQYSLTPRGGVDGFILEDGSQVHVSPRLSTQLVFLVRPGDTVTVHGVRAEQGGLILALSVANDAGGKPLLDPHANRQMHGAPVVAQGRIKAQLYDRRDEVDGVVLEDGSQIRLWPGLARHLAAELAPGQTIYARGFGRETLLGKLVLPEVIGPTEAEAVALPMHPMPGGPQGAPWEHGAMMQGPMMQGPGMHGPMMGGAMMQGPMMDGAMMHEHGHMRHGPGMEEPDGHAAAAAPAAAPAK